MSGDNLTVRLPNWASSDHKAWLISQQQQQHTLNWLFILLTDDMNLSSRYREKAGSETWNSLFSAAVANDKLLLVDGTASTQSVASSADHIKRSAIRISLCAANERIWMLP